MLHSNVLAQVAPDAGRLLQEERSRVAPAEPAKVAPPVSTAPAPVMPSAPESGVVVKVSSFKLDGVTVIEQTQLQAILAPSLGRSLGLRELQALAAELSAYYREKGYFLAQVILPPQDVTQGVVTMRVIEGQLKEGEQGIKVLGKESVSRELVYGMLRAPLSANNGVLRQEDLERGVLLLNDVPGVNASVTVQPGLTAETTALRVQLKDRPLVRGVATLDNIGNRYTGIYRAGASVYLDNPSGGGDQFVGAGTKAIDGHFNYARLGYSLPLNNHGLRLNTGLSHVNYRSGKELESQNATGQADSHSVGLTYPWVRSAQTNVMMSLNYESRRMTGDAVGLRTSDRTVKLGSAGLMLDHIDQWAGGGVSSASVTYANGSADLSRLSDALSTDQSTAQTHGSFSKLLYNLGRLQTITETTVLQWTLNGQSAPSRNLDTSEKFSLGGPSGVRAYPAGQGLGDSGLTTSIELRTVIDKNVKWGDVQIGEAQLALFYDYGRLQQYQNLWGGAIAGPNRYNLKGAGVGLNFGRAGVYDLRVYYARQIGENLGLTSAGKLSDGSTSRERVAMLLNVYF